jgi:hypothetical protein
VPLAKLAADHAADSTVIHHLLKEYTPVVDTVDLKPLAQFWSDPPPDVSFFYLFGEETRLRRH